jgi:hypothetical protein
MSNQKFQTPHEPRKKEKEEPPDDSIRIRLKVWSLMDPSSSYEILKKTETSCWLPKEYLPTMVDIRIRDIQLRVEMERITSFFDCIELVGFYDLSTKEKFPILMFLEKKNLERLERIMNQQEIEDQNDPLKRHKKPDILV